MAIGTLSPVLCRSCLLKKEHVVLHLRNGDMDSSLKSLTQSVRRRGPDARRGKVQSVLVSHTLSSKVEGLHIISLQGEQELQGVYVDLHAFAQTLEIPTVQLLPTCIEALDDLGLSRWAERVPKPAQ